MSSTNRRSILVIGLKAGVEESLAQWTTEKIKQAAEAERQKAADAGFDLHPVMISLDDNSALDEVRLCTASVLKY